MLPTEGNPEHRPPSNAMPAPLPVGPPRTNRALWCEVLAVLAIGVVPHLSMALVAAVDGPFKLSSFWVYYLDVSLRSACVSFAVLYLIHRSGEPWSAFGLVRPRFRDLIFGLLAFAALLVLDLQLGPLLYTDTVKSDEFFPLPKGAVDYVLLVIAQAANGFAEELVTRAYLITRLEQLLKSRLQAVLVSAGLFASYHLYYGSGGVLLMVFLHGLVFGGLYLLLRRLWPFALGHMLFNVVTEWSAAWNA